MLVPKSTAPGTLPDPGDGVKLIADRAADRADDHSQGAPDGFLAALLQAITPPAPITISAAPPATPADAQADAQTDASPNPASHSSTADDAKEGKDLAEDLLKGLLNGLVNGLQANPAPSSDERGQTGIPLSRQENDEPDAARLGRDAATGVGVPLLTLPPTVTDADAVLLAAATPLAQPAPIAVAADAAASQTMPAALAASSTPRNAPENAAKNTDESVAGKLASLIQAAMPIRPVMTGNAAVSVQGSGQNPVQDLSQGKSAQAASATPANLIATVTATPAASGVFSAITPLSAIIALAETLAPDRETLDERAAADSPEASLDPQSPGAPDDIQAALSLPSQPSARAQPPFPSASPPLAAADDLLDRSDFVTGLSFARQKDQEKPSAAALKGLFDPPANGPPASGANDFLASSMAALSQPQASAARAPTESLAHAAPRPVPVLEQVATSLFQSAHNQDGNGRYSVVLHPKELGRVDIDLRIDAAGTVSATLRADHYQTLTILQQGSHILENALRDAGLSLDGQSLSFGLRDSGKESDAHAQENGKQPNHRPRPGFEMEETIAPPRRTGNFSFFDISV